VVLEGGERGGRRRAEVELTTVCRNDLEIRLAAANVAEAISLASEDDADEKLPALVVGDDHRFLLGFGTSRRCARATSAYLLSGSRSTNRCQCGLALLG
jgi:hypothetical protein